MKKLLFSGLTLLGVLVLLALALPFLISSDAVRSSLLNRAQEITGREMQFNGDPRVSFSPFLGIEIRDVVFTSYNAGSDQNPILRMPILRAKLNFTAALRGQVTIDEFQFIQPEFNIRIFANGETNWAFPNGKVWRSLQEAKTVRETTETGTQPKIENLTDLNLGRFSVISGVINYQNDTSERNETITNFNGSLLWPNIKAGWTFNGEGIWRGDIVNMNLTAATPVMLMAGGSSKLNAQIKSETINVDFEGETNRFSDLFFIGKASATAPSLRKMIGFFGGQSGVGSNLLDFKASGNLSGTLKDLQIESAAISLDGNSYSGGLRFTNQLNKTNKISGTLASPVLDLTPYVTGLMSDAGLKGVFDILNQAETDLRLSASTMQVGGLKLSNFAGGFMVKDKNVKLDIGNAGIGDGIIVGNLQAIQNGDVYEVSAKIDAAAIDIASMEALEFISGIRPVGKSDIKLQLTSNGKEFADLAKETNGDFSIGMKSGQLLGLNFGDIRSLLNEATETQSNIRIGNSPKQTQVSDFALNTLINRGVGWVHDSQFKVDEFDVKMSGKADLRSGNLALWGIIAKQDAKTLPESSQFFLGGTLAEPLYVPQFGSALPEEQNITTVDPSNKASEPRTTN